MTEKMKKMIDVRDCPCDGCKVQLCGHPAKCMKFADWLNKTAYAAEQQKLLSLEVNGSSTIKCKVETVSLPWWKRVFNITYWFPLPEPPKEGQALIEDGQRKRMKRIARWFFEKTKELCFNLVSYIVDPLREFFCCMLRR